MISVTFVSIVQSVMLPEWNKAVEIEHSNELSYSFARIGEAVVLSSSTGNSNSVVLKGLDYPNRPLLMSPQHASLSINVEKLWMNLSYTEILPNGTQVSKIKNFTTYAIVVSPNYYYSTKPEFIFEHTAAFKKYGDDYVTISDQASFGNGIANIYLLNASFDSLSSVKSMSLIFKPVSYGGKILVDNATIAFKSANPDYWNKTLREIFGSSNVSANGEIISVTIEDSYLSIDYLVVQASTTNGYAEVNETKSPYRIVKLNPFDSYNLSAGESKEFGVRVEDKYSNPVPNVKVNVNLSNSSLGSLNIQDNTVITDKDGEAWVVLNTPDLQNDVEGMLNFSVNTSDGWLNVSYGIRVVAPESVGLDFPVAVSYDAELFDSYISVFEGGVNSTPPSSASVPTNVGDKTKIAKDDGVYLSTVALDDGYYAAHRFVFTVGNLSIEKIKINWNGYGDHTSSFGLDGATLYIWHYEDGNYIELGSTNSDVEVWLEAVISTGVSNYINGGNIIILVVQNDYTRTTGPRPYRGDSNLYTDYVQLIVVYK